MLFLGKYNESPSLDSSPAYNPGRHHGFSQLQRSAQDGREFCGPLKERLLQWKYIPSSYQAVHDTG